ncbi:helix-hairpin-helix domain-containing protein [Arcanobacterium canis]|uniref:Helix-hairpin-helix domain-containing protein n=1 Tax=Arcanobacterium canis TaxID=999183 RepID=A0ABY8FZT2_9ACTO|nr:helix-hairpin-helix domain-containing protein [Arcanobacterium canis]WFM84039.1 helix-hairpin-helix domain-containing protein [Arcanobacterium canis]
MDIPPPRAMRGIKRVPQHPSEYHAHTYADPAVPENLPADASEEQVGMERGTTFARVALSAGLGNDVGALSTPPPHRRLWWDAANARLISLTLVVSALVVCVILVWNRPGQAIEFPSAPSHSAMPSVTPVAIPSGTTNQQENQASQVVVYVSGAVKKPGVVRLDPGARVDDAVRAAGGFGKDADPNALNLAEKLADSAHVHVAAVGESAQRVQSGDNVAGGQHGKNKETRDSGSSVNLNTATASDLESVPGIGPVTASAIIEYRSSIGSFSSVDQLREVSGIGAKTLEKLRPHIRVS